VSRLYADSLLLPPIAFHSVNHRSHTIIPSTTATSVVAISRVRRLKRLDQRIQGKAASAAAIAIGCRSETLPPKPRL
jgi:hypothetical protein